MFFKAFTPAISILAILSATAPIVNGAPAEVFQCAALVSNQTADFGKLKTWWHKTGETNTKTAVANTTAPNNFFNSFVYEATPRNGNGKLCYPGKTDICNDDDQISIEADIGVDMAWTQFLSDADSIVRVTRSDKGSVDPANVVIRPTPLGFKLQKSGDALLITVPYSANGHRFSVEFTDDLWEYCNANQGLDSHYVQNKNSGGQNYVSSYTNSMPIVGVEPLNALLVFVSPFPSTNTAYTPDPQSTDIYRPKPGLITGLDSVQKSIVYFEPGVYWATGSAQRMLSSSATWSLDLRATGFGVLSGEQYVYQADTNLGFSNHKNDSSSLKMWRAEAAKGAKWTMHGLTTNAPPINSMDFYGADPGSFSVDASDYKQVGAFFGQTDGIRMYPGSHVREVFYHVGDDAIKTYYSNVVCETMTVWKTNNAPIVQFGWYGRDVSNVVVDSVDVIHTRYISQSPYWPRNLVASEASYLDDHSLSTADVTKHLSDYTISNWRCEGICPGLLGVNPMQNIDTMTFSNIYIEKFAPASTQLGNSSFLVFTDANNGNKPIALGDNLPNNLGLIIQNFTVGSEKISFDVNNWQAQSPGHSVGPLNIDGAYQGRWTVR